MFNRILVLAIPAFLFFNSCTETMEPEYINKYDPKSSEYTPTAPEYLSLQLSESPLGFEIRWKDKSFGESGFEIERKDTDNPEDINVGKVSADTTHFLDAFIPKLKIRYFYRIKTTTANGKFSYSDVVTYFTEIFLGPTALVVEHQSNNSIILYWVGRTSLAEGYYVKLREPNISGSNFNIIATVGKDIDHYLIENLDTTKVYELKVTAFNSIYNYEADSQTSVLVDF